MQYDTLLLDNDGVLLEYGFVERESFREEIRSLLEEHELAYTEDDVDTFMGHVDMDAVERFCEERGVETEALWREREHRFASLKGEHMEAGRKELYEDTEAIWAYADELATGIVSNNQHRTIEAVVDVFGLDEYIDTFYGKEASLEGFARQKPDPYYLDRAREDLDADAVLFVGDSEFDIRAARNAGVDVAYLRRDHNVDRELAVEPDYRIESLAELPAILDGEG